MKSTKTARFISSMLVVLSVAFLFGQSIPKTIKFMNCEWGSSPESVIAALNQELPEIEVRENKKVYRPSSKGNKSRREFNATTYFPFAGHYWGLQFIYSDNKLIMIFLVGQERDGWNEADRTKIIEGFDARYGEHEIVSALLRAFDSSAPKWEAEDGSNLILTAPRSTGEIWKMAIEYHAPDYIKEGK